MKKFNIAIVGATGAVGEELLTVLAELDFPVNKILALASGRSVNSTVNFQGREILVKELTHKVFKEHKIDIAFFSAGSAVSAKFAQDAVESGAVVIDNTSYFRIQDDVPLIVPEVNEKDLSLYKKRGIIANPNCSTIQMVHILSPLDKLYNLKRVDVSTYQAASGAGAKGMNELSEGLRDFFSFKLQDFKPKAFPHTLALNLIPHIDSFDEDTSYTKEELKMINETQKIMHKKLAISATCVRVPVLRSHSESISLTFSKEVDVDEVRQALSKEKHIVVMDNIQKAKYPMPLCISNTNETYVGRIRLDLYSKKILHLWCVADQLRVGAATNAVRIALKLIEDEEFKSRV